MSYVLCVLLLYYNVWCQYQYAHSTMYYFYIDYMSRALHVFTMSLALALIIYNILFDCLLYDCLFTMISCVFHVCHSLFLLRSQTFQAASALLPVCLMVQCCHLNVERNNYGPCMIRIFAIGAGAVRGLGGAHVIWRAASVLTHQICS